MVLSWFDALYGRPTSAMAKSASVATRPEMDVAFPATSPKPATTDLAWWRNKEKPVDLPPPPPAVYAEAEMPAMGGGPGFMWELYKNLESNPGLERQLGGRPNVILADRLSRGIDEKNQESLSPVDIARLAHDQDFRGEELVTMVALALAESEGVVTALGDAGSDRLSRKWGPSIGLWQIRSLVDPDSGNELDKVRVYENLYDPEYNAWAARQMFDSPKGLRHWTTWQGGKGKKFVEALPAAREAVMELQRLGYGQSDTD